MLVASFNRFDITEAHAVFEWHWSIGGWLRERPSNLRRHEATHVQLHRIGFKARPNLEFRTLSRNGRAVYLNLRRRYNLPKGT